MQRAIEKLGRGFSRLHERSSVRTQVGQYDFYGSDSRTRIDFGFAVRMHERGSSPSPRYRARQTAKLALPMALAQLGQIAMMTADVAFIGRISTEAVAAAALASRVYFVGVTIGMGLLAAVACLAAEAFGAHNFGRGTAVGTHGAVGGAAAIAPDHGATAAW